jgi:hypothetical protein
MTKVEDGGLAKRVQQFEASEQASDKARGVSDRCRDYYDGKQLTAEEIATLEKRGQPAVIINRIRRKVDWLRGMEMQSRTDPRAFPRTPQHQQGAEAATDAIRYVCDNQDWDKKRSSSWDNMLVEGYCGVEVVHKFKPPMREPEIVINNYSFDRLFYDPHSKEADFEDAQYKGAVIWSDADDLREEYPDKGDAIEASFAGNDSQSDTYDDRPAYQVWGSDDRKRVRVVLMYHRDKGKWNWTKFTKGGILESGESPYVDEDGESVCPLIMQSAYVDRDNNRYGVVLDMLSPQDEINARRSKALSLVTNRQTMGEKGAVDSVAKMKRELASATGHVEYNPDMKLEVVQSADLTQGQAMLLQEAKNEIDLMGANSGLAGKEGGSSQSGRAIMAKQQGGMIEIAPVNDRLSHFTRAVYRAVWMRVRQFWKDEKWIRITDDERNVRFVGLNKPVTLLDELSQMPEDQVMNYAMQYGLTRDDPRLQQVLRRENPVEEMDVDILIEEVPDMVTLQGETFEQLVNISNTRPDSIPVEILIEAAPNLKRDIKDKIMERLEQQQQMQQQQAQQGQPIAEAKAMAEIQKTQTEAQRNEATAAKTTVETQRLAMGY